MNPAYKATLSTLREQGIEVTITRKKVKNINFRIKVNRLDISAPWYASDIDIAYALHKRTTWVITTHQRLLKKQHQQLKYHTDPNQALPIMLWGQPFDIPMNETERLKLYRQQLIKVMPSLFAKWQPVVGKSAREYRIKKMKTRWGSCNTRVGRVWLSVYLPEYPLKCTEYVIVHELCHLHHANHSPKFWQAVAHAMPDYQQWHDRLAGQLGNKNQMVD